MASKGYMAKVGLDISDVDKKINTLNRELKAIDKGLQENGDSAVYAEQKYAVLEEQIDSYVGKLNKLIAAEQSVKDALAAGTITDADYRAYEREVENTTQALRKLEQAQRDLVGASGEASAGIDIFGDSLKANLATGVVNVVVAGIGKISEAAVQLVKDATAAYGQYQQLVGGVETLFSGAEDTVIQNAQNAFRTAGISANQYMEQVTSFSASLVSSLAGDTQAAADLADTAIRDMSDNANKMGTDMSSIQNAYQGFAKQNYTMLDNLKLGYGGTKTEMERLIADANKLKEANGEAGDLTISKFSDVVKAIHLVQEQMGITGTTAAEAAETIEGSAGAAQAAWENLVRGLADPAAKLDELIDDFIGAKTAELTNLLPTIEHSIEGVGQAIDTIIPKLTESGGIVDELITDVSEKAPGLVMSLAQNVIKGLPALADAALTIAENLIEGIADSMPELVPTLVKVISDMLTTIISHASELIQAANSLVMQLAAGIIKAIPELIDVAPKLISALLEELIQVSTEMIPELAKLGADLCGDIAEGLVNYDWSIAAAQAVDSVAKAFAEAWAKHDGYDTADEIAKKQEEADARLAEAEAKLKEAREQTARTIMETGKAKDATADYMTFLQSQSAASTEEAASSLEAMEKAWDMLYDYDKESNEAYWESRRKYLEEHKVNSEEWWKAWYETEKHFSDEAAQKEKELEKQRKEAEKAAEDAEKKRISDLKDSIDDAFKELEIQQTSEGRDKGWLLKQQRAYIDTLDKSGDLYREYDKKWRKDWADWTAKQAEDEKKRIDAAEKEAQKNTDTWEKYAEKQIDAQKKAVEKIQQAEKKTADTYSKRIQDFTEVTDTQGNKRLIIGDVREKTKELETYEKNLEKLKSKELPEGMLDDIMSMSFDQRALYIKELLRMSDNQRSKYFTDYARYQKTAQRIAHSEYSDDYEAAATDAAKATADIWSQMPDNATEEGRRAAKAYIDGYTQYMRENGLDTTYMQAVDLAGRAQQTAAQTVKGDLTINVAGKQAIKIALKDILAALKNSGAVIDV